MTTMSSPYSKHVHVLADLAHPAERDDAQRRARVGHVVSSVAGGSEEGQLGRRRRTRARRRGWRAAVPRVGVPARVGRGAGARRGGRRRPVGGAALRRLACSRARTSTRRDAARCPRSSRARAAGRPQRRGRVVHRERQRVARRRSPDRPARVVPWTWPIRAPGHERAHRVAAEGHDDRRVEHLELAPQVRRAGRDLVRLRVAVVGRAALDDVGDEHVLALPADRAQQLDEQRRRRGRRTAGPRGPR